MQKFDLIPKLAVIGNPIMQSLSPQVWLMFAKEFGLDITYERICAVDSIEFKKRITQFFATGGMAINITSPFKHEAFLISDYHTSLSGFCRTSNFICKMHPGSTPLKIELYADTTDGRGLVRDIELNVGVQLYNKKILIIGSGYVLDSVLLNIIACNPCGIDILARNALRVDALINKFGVGKYLENGRNSQYDVIINTLPNAAKHNLFESIIPNDNILCYDMAYAVDQTNFLIAMLRHNLNIVPKNGLGMLVEQAAVAFTALFDLKPDTQKVIKMLETYF